LNTVNSVSGHFFDGDRHDRFGAPKFCHTGPAGAAIKTCKTTVLITGDTIYIDSGYHDVD
jgi:hypothetical protein